MKYFQTESAAAEYCRRRNQGRIGDLMVVVDGPADDFVCMGLRAAQDDDFMYRVYF